jgi:hypothetical protein
MSSETSEFLQNTNTGKSLASIFCVCSVLYFAFGVTYMVRDRYVCSDDTFWLYTVLALTLPTGASMVTGCCLLPCFGQRAFVYVNVAFYIGMFIYGCLVIFDGGVCSEMKTHGLYIWAFFSLVVDVFGAAFMINEYRLVEAQGTKSEERGDENPLTGSTSV